MIHPYVSRRHCEDCHQAYHHVNGRTQILPEIRERHRLARQRARWKRKKVNTALVAWLKAGLLCADCGYSYPPRFMEFDHLPSAEKAVRIASAVRRLSTAALVRELLKTELVCADCHRGRTATRRAA